MQRNAKIVIFRDYKYLNFHIFKCTNPASTRLTKSQQKSPSFFFNNLNLACCTCYCRWPLRLPFAAQCLAATSRLLLLWTPWPISIQNLKNIVEGFTLRCVWICLYTVILDLEIYSLRMLIDVPTAMSTSHQNGEDAGTWRRSKRRLPKRKLLRRK